MVPRKAVIANVTVAVLLCAAAATAVLAQEADKDQQKAMEAYMAMMAPNENHVFLANFAGDWDVVTNAWMGPGATPTTGQGTYTAEMILGGRFVMMHYNGTIFGQPFEGYQVIGYDNIKKKYETFWIDNSSTSFYLTEGVRDQGGATIADTGLWADPMTGGSVKVRDEMKLVGPDAFTYELYMTQPDGTEFRSLQNIAVRRKVEGSE